MTSLHSKPSRVVLRTPEQRFDNLSDYPFSANYLQVEDDLRMHYVDEGRVDEKSATTQPDQSQQDVVLMLHGEPSWSYLYRFMIPHCVQAGHRVIAPDLIGFGKSDKLKNISDYSYRSHLQWLESLIEQLDLRNITLVCQDWGGLLGLRLAAEHPDRFARIVVGNSMLPTGETAIPPAFKAWRFFAVNSPWFPIGKIVSGGSRRRLNKTEIAAYDAPLPSSKYKAATRAFPRLVPVEYDTPGAAENREAWKVLKQWQKPFLTTFSSGDPIMRGGDKVFQAQVPGCKGQKHATLRGGHFLQEDSGPEFAAAVNAFIVANPLPSLAEPSVEPHVSESVAEKV